MWGALQLVSNFNPQSKQKKINVRIILNFQHALCILN
jgi:hypothetical protein